MVVTQLEELEKAKVKVYIDEEYAFLLYQKDIEQYNLQEGEELSITLYERIIEETVYRRAKQKVLAILKYKDRTEQELIDKLKEAYYSDEIIGRALVYVKEYGYQSDERYATSYIRSRMNTKSKLVIKSYLLQKGIKKDLVECILQEEYDTLEEEEDAEMRAIKKAISKKTKAPETLSREDKQKLMTSLYRKGFDIDKIKQMLD